MCDVHVGVEVEAAMPRSWAAHVLVIAAPRLLMQRPPEVPVGVALVAVVFEVGVGLGGRRVVHVDHMSGRVNVVGAVDHVRVGRARHWHGDVVRVARLRHGDMHHVDRRSLGTATALLSAAEFAMLHAPTVLPVVVVSDAVVPRDGHIDVSLTNVARQEEEQQ